MLIAKKKFQEKQLEEAAKKEWEQREKKLQGARRQVSRSVELTSVCSHVVAEVEAAKSKEEEVTQVELTPEERAAEIAEVEKELEILEERKHLYFLGLKKAWSLLLSAFCLLTSARCAFPALHLWAHYRLVDHTSELLS